jgi:hypothetical protein
MKVIRFVLASALFLLLLAIVYGIHITFFRVDVVFYSALFDGVIAAVITLALLSVLGYLRMLNHFETGQMLIIWLLIGYALAISIPTVIDRSLSFYILEKLEQRGGGIQLASFEDVITREYVQEHRLVDVRLTEQLESGTITIEGGCVRLTPWGQSLAGFSRYFRQHFLPKKRLLMGQYSDDLTDPFRSSRTDSDYGC